MNPTLKGTKDIPPVKLIAAILFNDESILNKTILKLESKFSPVDFRSEFFSFTQSDYYEPEMGANLQRILISFTDPVAPETLVQAKLIAGQIEEEALSQGKRAVNIDTGYLDLFKLVLASLKGRNNKIYISDGIWADMVLYFKGGEFHPFEWSFPDFKSGIFNSALKKIRENFKLQLKG